MAGYATLACLKVAFVSPELLETGHLPAFDVTKMIQSNGTFPLSGLDIKSESEGKRKSSRPTEWARMQTP